MKYIEYIQKNKILQESLVGEKYPIHILSNIVVNQLMDILEYEFRIKGLNAQVQFGDYDNIVQDSLKYQKSNCIILFWELSNLIDGLDYKIESLSDDLVEQLYQKTLSEIDLVFKNLAETSLVICNQFTAKLFSSDSLKQTKLESLSIRLNLFLEKNKPQNVTIIDIDKVISTCGIKQSIDLRSYYSSKSLYSIEFYIHYSQYIKALILSLNGKAKKALILDCDNTLWQGILGEDGFDGIKIFKDIQYLIKDLAKKGIIIGLCSKNNRDDIDTVINKHPDMILSDKDILIKKINWQDKASNLKEIALDLNIGLDSMVFIDDSDFEVNLIKTTIPEVEVVQVPPKRYQYAPLIRKLSSLFFTISDNDEDINKLSRYKDQAKRVAYQSSFNGIEDYLKSLELKVIVYKNSTQFLSRMAQLTQKTNQFNLTTKRYSEQDIKNFIDSQDSILLAIDVIDKFGNNGLTGLIIVSKEGKVAKIDSFLLSCRVLGRNIEYKLFELLINELVNDNIEQLSAYYSKTLKNEQVADLYQKLGMQQISDTTNERRYSLELKSYKPTNFNYIMVSKKWKIK